MHITISINDHEVYFIFVEVSSSVKDQGIAPNGLSSAPFQQLRQQNGFSKQVSIHTPLVARLIDCLKFVILTLESALDSADLALLYVSCITSDPWGALNMYTALATTK